MLQKNNNGTHILDAERKKKNGQKARPMNKTNAPCYLINRNAAI